MLYEDAVQVPRSKYRDVASDTTGDRQRSYAGTQKRNHDLKALIRNRLVAFTEHCLHFCYE